MCCSDIWDWDKRPEKPNGKCKDCGEDLYDGLPGSKGKYGKAAS